MARVWNAMKQMFGASAFCAAYGDVPNPIWTAAVSKLTDDECRAGLSALAKQKRTYPANLTEFVNACKPGTGSPAMLGVPTTPEALRRALPPPNRLARPEVIDGWLAKMRKRVGSVAVQSQERDSADLLAGACTCRSSGECAVCRSYSGDAA